MNDLLCAFGDHFPPLAARILHRDRHKTRNFREETITDLIMAGLTAFEPFGVFVDFPKDESRTGEDMIWEFVSPSAVDGRRYLCLHIQAKRAILGAPKRNPYWWYRELDHQSAKGAGHGAQAQRLLANARPGNVPLYMFYHTLDALAPENTKQGLPAIEGVNVMFAHHLRPILRAKPPSAGNKRWTTDERKVEKWRPHFMRFADVLCFGGGPLKFTVPSDQIAFLISFARTLFSPGLLADKLQELRSDQSWSGGEEDDWPLIEAVEDIPQETMQAIEMRRRGEKASVEQPRAIFFAGEVE